MIKSYFITLEVLYIKMLITTSLNLIMNNTLSLISIIDQNLIDGKMLIMRTATIAVKLLSIFLSARHNIAIL